VLAALVATALEAPKYLIVSAPRYSKVEYFKLPEDHKELGAMHPLPLIDSGLKSPQGLAVDGKNQKLFVADPDQRKVFCYKLVFTNGLLMVDGDSWVAAQNVEARWIAVDGIGNLFITDEMQNVINKVTGEQLAANQPNAHVIYDGATVAEVNRPGGIATDNFHVFWSNKAIGTQVGSVVRGLEDPDTSAGSSTVTQVSKNANKVYGVCLSQNNVYYTDSQTFMYGVKKNGGAIATISDKLLGPRGCAWDGDGTVYVADKTANAIYSFAGNMHILRPAQLTKVADYDAAFGIAVIQSHAAVASFVALLAFAAL
jgi:hypothetical protein